MSIELHNCDCIEYMKECKNNQFDLAIVDPPYGIGENRGQDKSRNINRVDKRNGKPIIIDHPGYEKKAWDDNPPNYAYFAELKRISKNQIIWGANHFIENIPQSNSSCWIVWDKCNGKSDFADCELAYTSFKTAVRKITFMWSGFCQGKSIDEGFINQGNKSLCEKRIHPTQKPVALYKWLLVNYANKGDLIFDSHLGSGSIAIACHDHKFDLVGCESDKDYFEKAKKRIDDHQRQLSLF